MASVSAIFPNVICYRFYTKLVVIKDFLKRNLKFNCFHHTLFVTPTLDYNNIKKAIMNHQILLSDIVVKNSLPTSILAFTGQIS